MKAHHSLIFLILAFCFVPAFSQKADQTNGWIFYTGNHKLTEKWGIHTDFQFRRSEFFKKWQQAQARVGIEYYISETTTATAGYSFINTWPYGDFAEEAIPKYNHYEFGEHRAWEQFQTKQQLGRFYTQSRFRIEQRWIEHKAFDAETQNYTYDGYQYRNRFRYRYMVQIPISHKEMSDGTLFFQWSNELFLNFGKGVKANLLDQNRMYFALGWRFNHHFNIQAGYMNQFIEKPDGVHKENNHTAQVSITYNLNFTSKK